MTHSNRPTLANFRAHWLVGGRHLQTIIPNLLPAPREPLGTRRHFVHLADNDILVLHENNPSIEAIVDRSVLLVHGLCGSHASGTIVRMTRRLLDQGIRVWRLDMRGCGAGFDLARGAFHAARWSDLFAATEHVASHNSSVPLTMIGFSLGANLLLKMLATYRDELPAIVSGGIAIAPPIDLEHCCLGMQDGLAKIYDRVFAYRLWRDFCKRRANITSQELVTITHHPTTLWDFDNNVTRLLAGYESAISYYHASSAINDLHKIALPTLILSAADDPIVPASIFHSAQFARRTTLWMSSGGGHLGFWAQDRRGEWLNDQILHWIMSDSAPA